MTLVASALAGGDCIDDADALRAGSTGRVLGCVVKAPSTLGTFLRSFRWGHVRQLDRVGRELLARAWAAGAGPGEAPFTIDLDSTICETYGLAKEGARHHGYTGQQRVIAPLASVAMMTGALLAQAVGFADGGVQVDGQGQVPGTSPSGPGPGQQFAAHPVQLADVAPAKAAQEGAQSLPPRRRGVDGAFTVPPRAQAVRPARSASASSMQSPPASADATRVISLSPVLARPSALPRSR